MMKSQRFAHFRIAFGVMSSLSLALSAYPVLSQDFTSPPLVQTDPQPLLPDRTEMATRGRSEAQTSLFLDAVSFAESGVRTYNPKIVGGTPAPEGAYPWLVSIGTAGKPHSLGHFCGGSFISARWVVTAAHCLEGVRSANELQIKYGSNSLTSGGTIVKVIDMKPHPDWNDVKFDNDIALLKLEKAAPDAVPVKIVNVADQQLFFDGVLAYVAGWGRTSQRGQSPNELRHVGLEVVSNEICSRPASYPGRITGNMFCAGFVEGRKDSCQGDSGGPLMVSDRRGGYILAGIVSWGDGCAQKNKYGVYTRVALYNDWIAKETR